MTSSYDKDALVNALLGKSTPTQSPWGSLFDPPAAPTPPAPFGSLLGSTEFGSLFDPSPAPPKNALAGLLGMIGQPSPPPASSLSGLFASNSLADLIAPPVASVRPVRAGDGQAKGILLLPLRRYHPR
jgi:hypothetical protein